DALADFIAREVEPIAVHTDQRDEFPEGALRALVYRACSDTDPRSFLPFQAKLFATEAALDVTRSAVQLGGASSYVEGSPIERLARDAYAATLHFENNDFLRSFVGRTLVQA
ncbi:MAG: acyl-CoA dehydrogenase family protein, partial [Myxococcota bacterium]